LSPNSTVFQNCLATLTPILDNPATPANEALGFISTAGPQVFTVGNASGLKPEKATTYGVGVVLTAPRSFADLTFAADYFHIKVKDELQTIGTTILDRCYEATDFPNNFYCDLIAPRLPAGNSQQGNLSSFQNPFLNVSSQTVSGIDFNVRYATPVFGGRFVAELEATRNLHQFFQLFSDDDPFDYVGTLGVQGFAAGPKWTGDLDLRFTTANDITFRWGINYVGRQTSKKVVGEFDNCLAFVGCVAGDLTANTYITHGASVRWNWRNIGQFTIGMNNIFNRKPPTISTYGSSAGTYPRIGNYFNSSNYDMLGRSIFANVTKTFK
jgi:iron complex outermembrane recepter protein